MYGDVFVQIQPHRVLFFLCTWMRTEKRMLNLNKTKSDIYGMNEMRKCQSVWVCVGVGVCCGFSFFVCVGLCCTSL